VYFTSFENRRGRELTIDLLIEEAEKRERERRKFVFSKEFFQEKENKKKENQKCNYLAVCLYLIVKVIE